MTTKETKLKNKVVNRTQVYRAIYYSGFDWSKTRTGAADSYKLVCKETNHTIYIDHTLDESLKMEILNVRTSDQLNEKELDRFSRLCHKIMRRTSGLGIHQDLIELKEQQEEK